MSRITLGLLSQALALCVIACALQSTFGQTPARPIPTPNQTPPDVHGRVTESVVNSSIPDDERVDQMLKLYSPKVRELDLVIGKLAGDLRKGGVGGGSLGNFVTDGMRSRAGQKLGKQVILAVTNSGGLRKAVIADGDLRLRDIFELMPFENALVAFDLSGTQVLDLLRVVVSHRDAQSGALIKYRINSDKTPELESARLLINGLPKEIDPASIYTVVSTDYLLNVTGSDYSLLRQGKNIQGVGLTLRDAITQYVKEEMAAKGAIKSTLDGRFVFDKAASPGMQEPQP